MTFCVFHNSSLEHYCICELYYTYCVLPLKFCIYIKVIANVGGGWSSSRSTFVAPFGGYYFFSYSIGLFKTVYKPPVVALRIITKSINVCLLAGGLNLPSSGVDTASRSCMIRLNKFDEVITTMIAPSSIISSAQAPLTSFSGFFYSPAATNLVIIITIRLMITNLIEHSTI